MSDIPPPKDIKPSLFERMGGQPSPAVAARLHGASASATGLPAPSSTAPVFAVPVSKKPKNEDGHSHSSTSASASKLLPLHGLLERARAATERQQLGLADRYFSLAAAHYSSRFSQESTLDHASVLLLLGESTRAASIAAALAEALPPTSPMMERAVYIQGAALLAAEDFAGCQQALLRGLALFPHSQQMKETLAEAESELAASRAGVSSNDCLLSHSPIEIKPSFTLQ